MTTSIDESKLHDLLARAIVDFRAVSIAPLVLIGDRLGLYRALAQSGPVTAAELATHTGTHERYVREWLNAQAASGYVRYRAEAAALGEPRRARALEHSSFGSSHPHRHREAFRRMDAD